MARKNVIQQDLFMQWYPIKSAFDGSASTTLVESEFSTGLSIRGQYAWLIHRVEVYCPSLHQLKEAATAQVALSTVQGEATFPQVNEKGVICMLGMTLFNEGAAGQSFAQQPWIWTSMPPTIIASPKLSFYCNTETASASLQGDEIIGRIGYTTVPIDQKMYLEIAETFETL